MSINLVQSFKFETDDLQDFEKMLKLIAPTMFRHSNNQYVQLHLHGKEPTWWNNGKDYIRNENCVVPMGDKFSIVEPCATYYGATQLEVVETFDTKEEASTRACRLHDGKDQKPPHRMWIATLDDSKHSFQRGKDIYCAGIDEMIKKSMRAVESTNPHDFYEKFGDGYNSWFNHGDGSVRHGYRAAMEWMGGRQVLVLSMVHMYYGK